MQPEPTIPVTHNQICGCCSVAQKTKPTKSGKLRLPRGQGGQWKQRGAAIYCPACWRKLYRLCAVTFPVAACLDAEWSEFTAAARAACREAGRLTNWAVTELAKAEVVPAGDKIGPAPHPYLYGLLKGFPRIGAWSGAMGSAQAVLHAAGLRYDRRRFEAVWLMRASLPNTRDTCPFPMPSGTAKMAYAHIPTEAGGDPKSMTVSVPLGGRRWLIKLRGGPEMRQQAEEFGQMVSGEAIPGEVAVYFRRSEGSNRRGGTVKTPGGGNGFAVRYFVKIAAWLPRDERERSRKGALVVRTGRKALLVASNGSSAWLYHADQLRGLIRRHEKALEGLADDFKAEVRRPAPRRHRHNAKMDVICRKVNARIDSEMRRMAAFVVGLAIRRRKAAIQYDDSERRYFPSFPWAKLAAYIAEKADKEGVGFAASAEVVETVSTAESGENSDC